MEARSEAAPRVAVAEGQEPASWTRPLVKLDKAWTKFEMYLVLALLIGAIFYMTAWVGLNAFHTKGGKLAQFPGGILTFAGLASALAWTKRPIPERNPRALIVPAVLFVVGVILLAVAKKTEYFANVSRWLSDASLIRQMGTPQIVSARLFTIWVALLGGSLATGAGRQINVDVVMRFLGPKPRLVVALMGYVLAASACFVISWGFLDYLAITRYGATKESKAGEKLGLVARSMGRHTFLVRKQIGLDLRSFGNVVLAGKPYDKWYTGEEWNRELNEGGWADHYPQPAPTTAPAVPYPSKPCLGQKELEDLSAKGGSVNPEWRLVGACDQGGPGATRAPLATAPEPDDRTPLEADLSLLFPLGFFMIGLRFMLRGALAAGGAVSTDPNAAHGGDDHAVEPPIVESRVDQEARAHEGEGALPADDTDVGDALAAAHAKVDAGVVDRDNIDKGGTGERPHHDVHEEVTVAANYEASTIALEKPALEDHPSVEMTKVGQVPPELATKAKAETTRPPPSQHDAPTKPPPPMPAEKRASAPPAEGIPTAQRLEIAQKIAVEEEEERTLVGDLSELARAQELIEQKKEEEEKKKRGGK